MADIFLSYARENAEVAGRLARALEARGWSVFWDRRIPAGRRFADVIAQQMAAARCVLVLWSTAANGSDWVLEEAEEGRKRNILTPARIEDIEPPWGFRRINAADLLGWQGDDAHAGFGRLLEDVAEVLGEARPAAPAVVPMRAPTPSTGETRAPTSVPVAPPAREALHASPARAAAPVMSSKLGYRMFEQLKRGVRAVQPEGTWIANTGSTLKGWWSLNDARGRAWLRAKPSTNQLRVRIRGRDAGKGSSRLTYEGWLVEDAATVARSEADVAIIVERIRAEWG